jgi:tetratricopeptide (TPR) repeat protein
MALPKDLVSAVTEGRAVLFLGAGASRGAKDSGRKDIPLACDLAGELVEKFLGPEYRGSDFRTAYDLSCSQRDVPTVQRYLFDRLNPFEPAPFHLKVAELPWAGLMTTNYDLVVERSYKQSKSPIQRLIPNVKDGDGSTARLDHRSVLFVKLHGCITQHHEVHPPLVASTEQLIAFRDGRQGQFDNFLEWAKTKSIIFVGYSFFDPNLRALFNEIVKEGDNRPRHYIINPALRQAEETYWSDRRVGTLGVTYEELLKQLDREVPAGKRKLSLLASHALHASSFARFITVAGRHESEDLKSYLTSVIDHVSSDLRAAHQQTDKFYRGFDLGWFPIQADLDVTRTIAGEIIAEQIIPAPPAERASLVVLKGHAGSGKSVTLRRVAWEAAVRHGKLVFFVNRSGTIDLQRFEEIFSLTNLPVYLFVDDVSEQRDDVLELIELIRKARSSVRILCAENYHLWNVSCDDLEPRVSKVYEMRYLSEDAIEELVAKLEAHNCLGYLKSLPLDRRLHELKYKHGRQLLVALLEATHGVPLIEIVANEYKSIYPPEARTIYLDICSLHRFGPPVRAGIISRIHNITFDQFRDQFLLPLEQIVTLRTDPKSGDYVYEARHSHIANVVYDVAFKTQEERFDNLIRILSKLNPAFSYDLEVLAQLIRAANVEAIISDPHRGRQVYEVALVSAGRRVVIFHQRGIYEMHVAANAAEFNRAEEFLNEALSMESWNKSIKHSLAELDLRRSKWASNPIERFAWRRNAISRAEALTSGTINSYPYATLAKAAIDDVKDALAAAESSESDATMQALSTAIAQSEEVLRRGMQAFTNDPVLLSAEGELSTTLAQAARAEGAFRRAFAANPRSTSVARRLARIQKSKGAHAEAVATLRQSLEANPSSRELQFDLALTMMGAAPDADQTQSDEVLYHLQRAFTPGDRNYQAQFLYARQLCVAGKYEGAKAIFAKLGEAKVPYRQKIQVGSYLLTEQGQPKRLNGSITVLKPSFGFIRCNEVALDAYFEVSNLSFSADEIAEGVPVTFELGFNLRGPVAMEIRLPGI